MARSLRARQLDAATVIAAASGVLSEQGYAGMTLPPPFHAFIDHLVTAPDEKRTSP